MCFVREVFGVEQRITWKTGGFFCCCDATERQHIDFLAMQQSGSILINHFWSTSEGRPLRAMVQFRITLVVTDGLLESPVVTDLRVGGVPGGDRLQGWSSPRWLQILGLVKSAVVTDFRVGRVRGGYRL